jgi:RecJ-like exonuclease
VASNPIQTKGRCETCQGDGEVDRLLPDGSGYRTEKCQACEPCPICQGTGTRGQTDENRMVVIECEVCGGSGRISQTRADKEDPDDTAKLEAALTRFEDKMREYHGTLAATRRDRDTARISHEMQQRNTTRFMLERDALAAAIKTAVGCIRNGNPDYALEILEDAIDGE